MMSQEIFRNDPKGRSRGRHRPMHNLLGFFSLAQKRKSLIIGYPLRTSSLAMVSHPLVKQEIIAFTRNSFVVDVDGLEGANF